MTTGEKPISLCIFQIQDRNWGLTIAQVSEVSGLQIETETEPYEEGGVNDYVHQLPKRTKYQHIILKRGITDLDEMWKWSQEVVSGKFKRKSGSIILINSSGEEKLALEFLGCISC